MRGIFFDEESAREVERQLSNDGYSVALGKVSYAGEDDDQDHPWAVTTDAPSIALEVLVDRFDGWLDDEDENTAPVSAPVQLPSTPRRQHRPSD